MNNKVNSNNARYGSGLGFALLVIFCWGKPDLLDNTIELVGALAKYFLHLAG